MVTRVSIGSLVICITPLNVNDMHTSNKNSPLSVNATSHPTIGTSGINLKCDLKQTRTQGGGIKGNPQPAEQC